MPMPLHFPRCLYVTVPPCSMWPRTVVTRVVAAAAARPGPHRRLPSWCGWTRSARSARSWAWPSSQPGGGRAVGAAVGSVGWVGAGTWAGRHEVSWAVWFTGRFRCYSADASRLAVDVLQEISLRVATATDCVPWPTNCCPRQPTPIGRSLETAFPPSSLSRVHLWSVFPFTASRRV